MRVMDVKHVREIDSTVCGHRWKQGVVGNDIAIFTPESDKLPFTIITIGKEQEGSVFTSVVYRE